MDAIHPALLTAAAVPAYSHSARPLREDTDWISSPVFHPLTGSLCKSSKRPVPFIAFMMRYEISVFILASLPKLVNRFFALSSKNTTAGTASRLFYFGMYIHSKSGSRNASVSHTQVCTGKLSYCKTVRIMIQYPQCGYCTRASMHGVHWRIKIGFRLAPIGATGEDAGLYLFPVSKGGLFPWRGLPLLP